jgi:hypothetical protein
MHRDISFLVVLFENVLDFVVGEVATCSCARAFLCAALHYTDGKPSKFIRWDLRKIIFTGLTYAEWAAGLCTTRVLKGKCSTVEAEAKSNLGWIDSDAPEQLRCLLNFGEIGMSLNNCATAKMVSLVAVPHVCSTHTGLSESHIPWRS